ncbi:MAG: hypothetical protein ACYDCK_01245 [Thermoplasmatota archaeon]
MRAIVFLTVILLAAPLVTAFAPPVNAPAVPATPPANVASLLAKRDAILNSAPHAGLTPQEWIDLARGLGATRSVAPSGATAPLADSMLKLYALVGHSTTANERAALASSAAAIPTELQAPFASLVATTADVYAKQLQFLPAVIASEMAMKQGEPGFAVLPDAVQQGMRANALEELAAIHAFEISVPRGTYPAATPIFADPLGLVKLGGTGNDVYERDGQFKDQILVVDLGGDDTYHNSAGGATLDPIGIIADPNLLALSVNVDLAGNDLYDYHGDVSVAQGSGAVGGLGILVDAGGNDVYRVTNAPHRQPITTYIEGASQGSGEAGFGLLVDSGGSNIFDFKSETLNTENYLLGQGFGGAGGTGILATLGGGAQQFHDNIWSNASGSGLFIGNYAQGTSLYGGVGLLYDDGGPITSQGFVEAPFADYYAQGFGAFGGLGIMVHGPGSGDYTAVEVGHASGELNCAYGTADYGAVGIFLDLGGNDSYYTATTAPDAAFSMSEGFSVAGTALFVDAGGSDQHLTYAFGPHAQVSGRGVVATRGNPLLGPAFGGVYLDLGGTDTYVGPGGNNEIWATGADVEAGVVPTPTTSP